MESRPSSNGLTPVMPTALGIGTEGCATFRPGVLRRRDDEITRTPHVEIPHVVQRPMRLRVPRGRVTTARTQLPRVVATGGDDLGLRQVCERRDTFRRVRSIRTWTELGGLNWAHPGYLLHAFSSLRASGCPAFLSAAVVSHALQWRGVRRDSILCSRPRWHTYSRSDARHWRDEPLPCLQGSTNSVTM